MSFLNKVGQSLAQFFGETTLLDPLKDNTPSSDFLDPSYLSELLSYRLFDEDRKIYENKNSLGFVIEVIPILGANEDTQKELSNLIREIGEEKASIQALMWADPRIERFLDLWSKPRMDRGGVFQKVALKKQEFLRQESIHGNPPPRIFRFLFSYSEPKRNEAYQDITLNRLLEKKKKALETFSRISQCFEVGPSQLLEIVSGLVNFKKEPAIETKKWSKDTWLSNQIGMPGTAIECFHDKLLFHDISGSSQFKTYDVTDYPDEWALPYMGELIGDFLNRSYCIPSSFYIHYGLYFPSQSKLQTKFFGKTKMLEHQLKFPKLVSMFPSMPREHEEQLYVQRQLRDGEKFVETRMTCGLWAAPEQHLQSESALCALFQKYGFRIKGNHFIHLPDFISSLPMGWGEDAPFIKRLNRARCIRTTVSSETGCLMPIVGEWWGNSTKGMILSGRKGQIASWDPFCSEGNLNAVVVGPSGSGKSVFMQDLIFSHLGQGGKVYVLDLGRSFQKLCHLLEGQLLEFSQKSRLNLNPFACMKGIEDPDSINTALEIVSSIIATMAMPTCKIDKERGDILNALVKTAWEKNHKNASVDDVIALLENLSFHSELMVGATESLKEGLKKFSKNGIYAPYFYGDQKVDLTKEFVVIETEELKNMADLQAVILQIFTLTISNQIFMGNREQRSLICIDEAWDLLKSPQMEGFIESLARRLRKYNGSLVIGTQGLKDFERSPGARAAFHNSNWLVMLGKDNDSINILKKENLIPMDSFKEMALSSLHMEGGKYSELFIYNKGTGFCSLNQLKLDPFSSMLYSTKAEEFQAIQILENQGKNMEQALEWLMIHRVIFKHLIQKGYRASEAIQTILIQNPQGDYK